MVVGGNLFDEGLDMADGREVWPDRGRLRGSQAWGAAGLAGGWFEGWAGLTGGRFGGWQVWQAGWFDWLVWPGADLTGGRPMTRMGGMGKDKKMPV